MAPPCDICQVFLHVFFLSPRRCGQNPLFARKSLSTCLIRHIRVNWCIPQWATKGVRCVQQPNSGTVLSLYQGRLVLGTVRGGFLALTVVVSLVVGTFHAAPKVAHHLAARTTAPKMITILWFGGSRPLPHALGIRPHLATPVVHHKVARKPVAHDWASSITPYVMSQWAKVNQCEEGGNWHVRGSVYSGGLGITNYNWVRFGGTQFAQNASDATPIQQVTVARRIQASDGVGNYVPDQYGCGHGW